MIKNQSGQKWTLFAFDAVTGLPKTGDAANITPYVAKDDGSVTAVSAPSVTEKSASAPGEYLVSLTQAETNADKLDFSATSSTSNVIIVPRTIYTNSPQSGDAYARLGAPAGASVSADVATVKSDTGNLVARLGAWTGAGLNTVLGALRAIAAKAAGLTPSDLTSGTAFNNTTDSLEAIGDRGDADWGVTIMPVVSTVGTGEVKAKRIIAYQYAAFSFTFAIADQTGTAIDLTGHDITFVVGQPDTLWQIDDCAVGGVDNNIVTVAADDTNTSAAGEFTYALRDLTTDSVIARGELAIMPTPDAA
jgi:hypothetical protein